MPVLSCAGWLFLDKESKRMVSEEMRTAHFHVSGVLRNLRSQRRVRMGVRVMLLDIVFSIIQASTTCESNAERRTLLSHDLVARVNIIVGAQDSISQVLMMHPVGCSLQ